MKNKRLLTMIIVSILSLSVFLMACSPAATVESVQTQDVVEEVMLIKDTQAPVEAQEAVLVTGMDDNQDTEDTEPVADVDCPICAMDTSSYSGPLTEAEIQGLLLALNDEYHAWAVYDQVLQDFGSVRPFSNIVNSEATHINELEGLFEVYGLNVPENPWIGNVPSFATTNEACAIGVEAEVLNLELYEHLFATTDRADIITVYEALQRASNEKHLPAFERCAR